MYLWRGTRDAYYPRQEDHNSGALAGLADGREGIPYRQETIDGNSDEQQRWQVQAEDPKARHDPTNHGNTLID